MHGAERQLLAIAKRHMATDFEFEVVVDSARVRAADSVLLECHSVVARIESELTEFRDTSPVWCLNHSAGEWIEAPPHLMTLLRLGKSFMAETHGYFSLFAKSKTKVSEKALEIDFSGKRIRRLNPELHLSFGAIGKGYALDAVRSLLVQQGFSDFRLNSGGSSWIFSGLNPLGEPWKLAWAWKKDEDGDFAGKVLSLLSEDAKAIGISGTLEQGNHFFYEGVSPETRIQSAFYAGRSAAEADAFSTALYIGAGFEGEKILTKLANGMRKPSIAYVDLEEQFVYNEDFATRFLSDAFRPH